MKKILYAVIVAAGISAVRADYLYWMVDNPVDGFDWSTAKVVMGNPGSVVGELTSSDAADLKLINGYATANIGTSYIDSTSFFIELYNQSSQKIATADIGTASTLQSFISSSLTDIPTGLSFTPSPSAFNVPEPTSGLLFLVGGMLLGLRRKRRV